NPCRDSPNRCSSIWCFSASNPSYRIGIAARCLSIRPPENRIGGTLSDSSLNYRQPRDTSDEISDSASALDVQHISQSRHEFQTVVAAVLRRNGIWRGFDDRRQLRRYQSGGGWPRLSLKILAGEHCQWGIRSPARLMLPLSR